MKPDRMRLVQRGLFMTETLLRDILLVAVAADTEISVIMAQCTSITALGCETTAAAGNGSRGAVQS